MVDETLLQRVGKPLVNQRVADEGSSSAQRGFQLTTGRNIHTEKKQYIISLFFLTALFFCKLSRMRRKIKQNMVILKRNCHLAQTEDKEERETENGKGLFVGKDIIHEIITFEDVYV